MKADTGTFFRDSNGLIANLYKGGWSPIILNTVEKKI